MTIKLDISKAYDWVQWPFLETILQKIRFNEKWIKLVMFCVKLVSFSILVNGEPKWYIKRTQTR